MSSDQPNLSDIGWKKDVIGESNDDIHPAESSAGDRSRNREITQKSAKKSRRKSSSSSSSSSSSDSGRDSSRSSISSSSSTSTSGSEDDKKKHKKEKRKRKYEEKKKRKEERRRRKAEKKELKRLKKKERKERKKAKKLAKKERKDKSEIASPPEPSDDFSVPVELMNYKANAPETPEEYEARQNRIRRVTDPETGRTRLIKGDGEILEEIVSRDRHKEINRQATKGDGNFFQSKTTGWRE